jgi:hypothetical protein
MMKADESFEVYQERMEKIFFQHPGRTPYQDHMAACCAMLWLLACNKT